MKIWATKDPDGQPTTHKTEPEPHNSHHGPYWAADVGGLRYQPWLVPASIWATIAHGECKCLELPDAFDPDGPVEVGDTVVGIASRRRGTVEHRFARDHDEIGVCFCGDRQRECVSRRQVRLLAKAPKPEPVEEPEPLAGCMHCGDDGVPVHNNNSQKEWVKCLVCKCYGPERDTQAEADAAWNLQNKGGE